MNNERYGVGVCSAEKVSKLIAGEADEPDFKEEMRRLGLGGSVRRPETPSQPTPSKDENSS